MFLILSPDIPEALARGIGKYLAHRMIANKGWVLTKSNTETDRITVCSHANVVVGLNHLVFNIPPTTDKGTKPIHVETVIDPMSQKGTLGVFEV